MSLIVENVSHRFEDAAVVNGASLRVAPGEVISLFGHSGCGKTTLLRIIAGLEPLQSGDISLDGETIANLPPEDRPIGLVFQDFVLFPHLTVEKNVAFGLKNDKDQKRRVSEQLAALGLTGLERRYPHQLSGGQQQRVAIARALAPHPALLLADEPTGNLDSANGEMIAGLLFEASSRRGTTLVLVTHDQALAERADRVVRLQSGRIVADGTAGRTSREAAMSA